MQTSEIPLAVAGVVHDRVEEDVQVVDIGVAVDQSLDGRGRFMRDDQVEPPVLFFDIDDGVFKLLVRRHGRRALSLVRLGRQTAAEGEDGLVLDGVQLAAVQTVDVVGDLLRRAAVERDFLIAFEQLEILVSALDKEDIELLLFELFQVLYFLFRIIRSFP